MFCMLGRMLRDDGEVMIANMIGSTNMGRYYPNLLVELATWVVERMRRHANIDHWVITTCVASIADHIFDPQQWGGGSAVNVQFPQVSFTVYTSRAHLDISCIYIHPELI